MKKFDYWSDLQRQRISDIIGINDRVFNAVVFLQVVKDPNLTSLPEKVGLFRRNQESVNSVIMRHQYYYGILNLSNQRCEAAKVQVKELINMLQQEYRLDEE